jgi:hypothetical protein
VRRLGGAIAGRVSQTAFGRLSKYRVRIFLIYRNLVNGTMLAIAAVLAA